MKSRALTLILCFLSVAVFAQKISADKVPSAVKNAFKAKFPSASEVKWGMEDKVDYEATFKNGKEEYSATFHSDGKWIETEREITAAKLPKEISESISKNFPGYKIKEASELETPENSKLYEAELTKGKELIEVQFKPTGEVLKKTVEKQEKKKED